MSVGTCNEPYVYEFFDELERNADGTLVLRIPGPHMIAAHAYLGSPAPSGNYLSRLLSQSSQISRPVSMSPRLSDTSNVPRRLSWER